MSINTQNDNTPKPELFYIESEQFQTSFGQLKGSESITVVNTLADNAFKHRITLSDETVSPITVPAPYVFNSSTDSRYNDSEFKGLLIDSGASTRSTGGIGQLKALQQLDTSVQLDKNTAGSANFTFGIGSAASIGSVDLDTPLGHITFHIVPVNTPFLLCLADMDKYGAFFNNITNQVIQSQTQPARHHPVIRRYGHAFLLWYTSAYILATESLVQNPCYLTDTELRRLHRRFGHPSVHRLHQLLERSGHNVELQALQYLTKYCEQCQKHGRSPGRFTFTLKDDLDFNYNVIIDIMYIGGKPVLHLVDEATRFQAGQWLKNVLAQYIWDQLRSCWIDTYLGPLDLVTANAGKQFMAKKFKQYAANMGIIVKNALVEAHHSIGMVERYHGPLRRVYSIVTSEIPGIEPDLALQMSFKAINDSVGPNGLVPTLLVFGAYPRMTELDAPSPSISQRAMAMKKAMDEVRKSTASRQINDALNTRNGPSTASVHDLPINSPVLVYREGNAGQSGEWKGPYNLLSIQGESVIIELPHGPTKFRNTSIKPYFIDNQKFILDNSASIQILPADKSPAGSAPTETPQTKTSSANNLPIKYAAKLSSATLAFLALVKQDRGRPRKYLKQANITAPLDI